MSRVPYHLRPPLDPYLRKGRPIVNHDAPKSTGAVDLLNRGQQLLLELDRQHKRLHDAVKGCPKAGSSGLESGEISKNRL